MLAQAFAKRLAAAIPVLIGVSIACFVLIRTVPGDPVTALLGLNYDEAAAESLRERYGLDKPLPVQYGIWAMHVLQGDLGRSVFTGEPVVQTLAERLPVTVELAFLALAVAVAVGLPLGVFAALRRGGAVDRSASLVGLLGLSVPGFWLGTMLILVFSLWGSLLPSGGYAPIREGIAVNLSHMILPALSLGLMVAAVITRMSRAAMLETLNQPYMAVAAAKGVSRRNLVWRHGLANALAHIVTAAGIQMGYLLAGSVVIEQVFSLPGVGRLAFQAIGNRDYALLQGVILLISVGFISVNLVVDLVCLVLDPKRRQTTA